MVKRVTQCNLQEGTCLLGGEEGIRVAPAGDHFNIRVFWLRLGLSLPVLISGGSFISLFRLAGTRK